MDDDVYRLIESLSDRVTDLSKSYRVLNEAHMETQSRLHTIELGQTELKTRIDTAISIVKWVLSPISLILLILRLYEMMR